MKELIAIYFAGLFVVTAWPSKVTPRPFINISQGLQFKIDDQSPVVSAEKDLLSLEKMEIEDFNKAKWASLNQLGPRRVAKYKPVIVDYSANLKEIQDQRLMTLQGPIQLKHGLALTDENRIEIYQIQNGQIVEQGEVDISSGMYKIQLTRMDGQICAKLKTGFSEIMGSGCADIIKTEMGPTTKTPGPLLSISRYQDVFELAENVKKVEKSAPVQLAQMAPIESVEPTQRLYGKIYDYYGYNSDQPRIIEKAQISNSVDSNESASSFLVTQVSAPNYVMSRIVSNRAAVRRGVPLLAQNAAKAMTDIARDMGYTDGDMNSRGTLWGRVYANGKTLAGAEVSLDGVSGAKPLYLNELYIPDPNLKVTASHGLYTFMNLPDGEYAVRADVGNRFAGFQNASVRTGTLSLADIESTIVKSEIQISTYDLRSKTALASVVTLQNYQEDLVLEEGVTEILAPQTADHSYAIVHPLDRNYLTTQHLVKAGERDLQFPQVHKDWIEGILSQAKLARGISGKIILGFGPQEPYRVFAIGSQSAQIIYFDSNAQVIEGSFGAAGGGYLILDPEEHVVEFATQRSNSKQLDVTYMPTTPGVVSIIR